MLDIVHYRSHVFRLGHYAEIEDDVEHLLEWQSSLAKKPDDRAPAALMEAGEESHEVLE
jgi:hypothetical protein